MHTRSRSMLAFGLVFVFGAGTWFGIQWYQQQVSALNLKSSSKSAAPRADKVETETGFVLVKANSGVLGELLRLDGVTQDSVIPGQGIVRLKVDLELASTGEVVDRAREVIQRVQPTAKGLEAYAEADAAVFPAFEPNDPLYPNQWHHRALKAPTAWDASTGAGSTVAIVDTGVDCTHPDIAANCVTGRNFYTGGSNTSDVVGHGTNVAGTVSAIGNNSTLVAGVGYSMKIMPLRVTSETGMAALSTIVTAINYAADQGVDVVNVSMAGVSTSTAVADAGAYLRSKGGTLVLASGNSATFSSFANSDYTVVVGALRQDEVIGAYSNTGNRMDFAAPGEDIYTLVNGGGAAYMMGTSFASPVIAAVFGVVSMANPSLSPVVVESIIKRTARDLGPAGWDTTYGWGIPDMGAAVAEAKNTGASDSTPPTAPANLTATLGTNNSSAILAWKPSTDNVGVSGYKVFRNGAEIGTSSTTDYTDLGLVSGTYRYTVRAFDAAGNTSAASNEASVTVPSNNLTITSGPSVPAKTTTSATIAWATNQASTSVVEYGLTSSLGSTMNDQTAVTAHSLTVTGLAPKTLYYYRVKSVTASGQTVTSAISTFRTRSR